MSTLQTLIEYEQRLRALGAPVLDRLRPGLSEAEINDLEREYDFPLTPTARGLWGWHDGAEPAAVNAWNTSLVPYGTFHGLRGALEESRTWRQTLDFLDPEEAGEAAWQPQWLIVSGANKYPTVLDCTRPTAVDTPTFRFNAEFGVVDGMRLHFHRWVQLWNWAIDQGIWTLAADGTWVVDQDRLPLSPSCIPLM